MSATLSGTLTMDLKRNLWPARVNVYMMSDGCVRWMHAHVVFIAVHLTLIPPISLSLSLSVFFLPTLV